MYAQAKELATSQRAVPLLTAGSLQTEERAGGRFVYRYRYNADGKRTAEYLGPESSPETASRVEQAKREIADQKEIGDYSQKLRRVGYYSADNSAVLTVASLFNAGVFSGGGILIGTHAFGSIVNELGISATPFPLTEDVDVARRERIELAALPEGGFLTLLEQSGLPFHEVPALKRGQPSTSFKVRGEKLKVDLLVPTRGVPFKPVRIPELGAHATGLPYLDYLLEETISSILVGRDRIVPVTVPHPGRFCLHKLALYDLRSRADDSKREKDVFQAAVIASALARDQDYLLTDAIKEAHGKLKSKMSGGVKLALKLLKDDQSEAAELLAKLG